MDTADDAFCEEDFRRMAVDFATKATDPRMNQFETFKERVNSIYGYLKTGKWDS